MINKAQKIFVEPDEEIVFTIEKINGAEAERVILVVPQNAALISSAVSLKILTRQITKGGKLVVLVSDNETGVKLAEKANLMAVSKISSVNKELWQKAKHLKEELISNKTKVKDELLGDRQEKRSEEKPQEISEEKVKAEIEEEEDNKEFSQLISQKPRLEDKIVEIGGITVVAGGDINDHRDVLDNELERLDFEPDASDYEVDENVPEAVFRNQEKNLGELKESAMAAKEGKSPVRKQLIGRDLTSLMPTKEKIASRTRQARATGGSLIGFKDKIANALKPLMAGGGNKRIIQIAIVVVVLFFLISYLFFPAVSITLIFKENEVRVTEVVTATTDAEEVSVDDLKLPATIISKTANVSKDGEATGTDERGEKAKGVITLFNDTSQPIKVNAGTTATNITSNLNYVLTQEVTVPATGSLDDVKVEASGYGENYNIVGLVRQFKIGSHPMSEMSGRNFADITGGLSKEVVIVTKEDIDAIKATAEEELKQQLLDSLESLISDEDILISGSEKFTQDEFKSSVKADEEAEDFSIDLKITVSAISVLKSDLKSMTEELVKKQDPSQAQAAINLGEPIIRDIQVPNKKSATFELSAKAGVTADVDDGELKKQLAGVSVGEARDFLKNIEGVEDYRLKYTPVYIPFFLQRIPSDESKIEIIKSFDTEAES